MTRWLVGLALGVAAISPASVSADSFTPVRMQVSIASVARLHQPLAVKVTVNADRGVLDVRSGSVRARVKLTDAECGGEFDHTAGTVLLDRALNPQPTPGLAYQGSAAGSGRPNAYGTMNVCVYLQDDYQQFASDTTSYQVNVSKPCTDTAARYDRALASLRRAQRALRHAHSSAQRRHLQHVVSQRAASANSAMRSAQSACGPGVPL